MVGKNWKYGCGTTKRNHRIVCLQNSIENRFNEIILRAVIPLS